MSGILPAPMLTLAHGLAFADLYSINGNRRIDGLFQAHLRAAEAALADRMDVARNDPAVMTVTMIQEQSHRFADAEGDTERQQAKTGKQQQKK